MWKLGTLFKPTADGHPCHPSDSMVDIEFASRERWAPAFGEREIPQMPRSVVVNKGRVDRKTSLVTWKREKSDRTMMAVGSSVADKEDGRYHLRRTSKPAEVPLGPIDASDYITSATFGIGSSHRSLCSAFPSWGPQGFPPPITPRNMFAKTPTSHSGMRRQIQDWAIGAP